MSNVKNRRQYITVLIGLQTNLGIANTAYRWTRYVNHFSGFGFKTINETLYGTSKTILKVFKSSSLFMKRLSEGQVINYATEHSQTRLIFTKMQKHCFVNDFENNKTGDNHTGNTSFVKICDQFRQNNLVCPRQLWIEGRQMTQAGYIYTKCICKTPLTLA